MPRTIALPLLLLVAAVAEAAEPRPAGHSRTPVQWDLTGQKIELHGWTASGSHLVFTRQVEYFALETAGQAGDRPMKLVFGVARDARTGAERRWLLELRDADGKATMRDELKSLRGPDDWKDWLAEQTLVDTRAQRSPDGRAVAEVAIGEGTVVWRKGGCDFDARGQGEVELTMSLRIEGRERAALQWHDEDPPAAGRVTASWSPDGKRVAWLLHRDRSVRSAPVDLLAVTPLGPRVQVLVPLAQKDHVPEMAARVEAVGTVVMRAKSSSQSPARTLIEHAPDFAAEAAALALALPGGADVRALATRTSFDLVVRLGVDFAEIPPPVAAVDRLGVAPAGDDDDAHHAARRAAMVQGIAGVVVALLLVALWAVYRRFRRRNRPA